VRNTVRRAGYKLARAVRGGTPNFWAEPYRLPEIELRIERKLPEVVGHIRHHPVTIILLHRIVSRPRVFTEWPTADFAALLGWMHSRNVRVVTLKELYGKWWQERLAKALIDATADSERDRNRLFQNVDVDATRTPHPR
jgi:hypothetical protein